MPTLKESTEKLVAATDRLLQDYKMERSARKVEEEKADAQIKDLKEQLTALQNKFELTVTKYEGELSASKTSIPNPTIQSHDTAAFSADQIDALVEEIDSCLSCLNLQNN
jgi:uncharacterized protein (DUF342 family)